MGRVPGGAPVEARGQVAVDGSRRVGLATYVVSEAGAELTAVKVIDQRQGIGRILVEHLRPVVSGAGATRLWARIANDEVETFAFLQRCGFRLTEIRVDDLILERSV